MSFHQRAQVDHVISMVIVTGDGRVVECSDRRHRELLEMVLAGQGQVGVIAEATLRLVPAPTNVRVYDLVYADLDPLLADLARLMNDGRFEQMEAFVFPTGSGEWVDLLEAIGFHGPAGPPDDAALVDGLQHVATAVPADLDFLTWSSRVAGLKQQPHPWIDLLLPMSAVSTFVREVQDAIAPIATGDTYSLLLIPLRRSRFGRPLFRTQQEELGIGFDALRALPTGTDAAAAIAFNEQLYDRCTQLGGRTTRSVPCASTSPIGSSTTASSGTGSLPPSVATTATTSSPAARTSSGALGDLPGQPEPSSSRPARSPCSR